MTLGENMSAGQPWYISHAEALTQNILGLLISFVILTWWGMTPTESVSLQAIFFVTSYIRSYAIRRFFNSLETKKME